MIQRPRMSFFDTVLNSTGTKGVSYLITAASTPLHLVARLSDCLICDQSLNSSPVGENTELGDGRWLEFSVAIQRSSGDV